MLLWTVNPFKFASWIHSLFIASCCARGSITITHNKSWVNVKSAQIQGCADTYNLPTAFNTYVLNKVFYFSFISLFSNFIIPAQVSSFFPNFIYNFMHEILFFFFFILYGYVKSTTFLLLGKQFIEERCGLNWQLWSSVNLILYFELIQNI